MKVLRRLVSLLTSAVLLSVVFSVSAYANSESAICTWDISAAEEDTVSASLYEISQGTYRVEIGGCGKMKNFSPSETPPWFEYSDGIVFVSIGEDVENLGRFTFNNCFGVSKSLYSPPAIIIYFINLSLI